MRMDNTRCTSGLVFLGTRPLDLPLLATRLERVLGGRGFRVGLSEMMSEGHLKMGLGGFELHMTTIENHREGDQPGGMQSMDMAMSDGFAPELDADLKVNSVTQTLTVTIIKLPSDLPSLREAERSTATAHSALALATLELAQVLDPDYVQWLQPDMMLSTSSFLSVLEKVTPRRVSAADRAANGQNETDRRKRPTPVLPLNQKGGATVSRLFPDIEDTCERLENQSRTDETPEVAPARADSSGLPYLRAVFNRDSEIGMTSATGDAASGTDKAADAAYDARSLTDEPSTTSRVATWAISLTVSLISVPIGLALMVYNLLRGEDLRLALTALALTGLFTGMAKLGMIDTVVATLSGLPVIGQILASLPI